MPTRQFTNLAKNAVMLPPTAGKLTSLLAAALLAVICAVLFAGGQTAQAQTPPDLPVVQFTTMDTAFHEEGDAVQLPITIDQTLTTPLTVHYRPHTNRTNTLREADYTTDGSLTIPAGNNSGTLSITIVDDDHVEDTERVYVQIYAPQSAGYTVGPNSTRIVSVTDTDEAKLSWDPYVVIGEGDGSHEITLSVSPTVEYAFVVALFGGTQNSPVLGELTADFDDDWSIDGADETDGREIFIRFEAMELQKTINLTIVDDSLAEGTEHSTLQFLRNNLDQYIHSPDKDRLTLVIQDNDVPQGFTVSTGVKPRQHIRKKALMVPEGSNGRVEVRVTQPPTEPVTVQYSLKGDGSISSSTPTSHTFNAGNWVRPWKIDVDAAQDDDTIDGIRTLQFNVTTDDGYYRDKSPRFVRVQEQDDDPDSTGQDTHTVDHGISPSITAEWEYVPKRHKGKQFYVLVRFSEPVKNGYQSIRDDVFEVTGAYISQAYRVYGQSDLWAIYVWPDQDDNVVIQLLGDHHCSERRAICSKNGNKKLGNTLTLAIAGSSGAAALPHDAGGLPKINISTNGTPTNEGDTTAFGVSIKGHATEPITFEFLTYGITATSQVDFEKVHQTFTIPMNGSSVLILVDVVDDSTVEGTESFGAVIFNPEGAVLGTNTAVAYINSDD